MSMREVEELYHDMQAMVDSMDGDIDNRLVCPRCKQDAHKKYWPRQYTKNRESYNQAFTPLTY